MAGYAGVVDIRTAQMYMQRESTENGSAESLTPVLDLLVIEANPFVLRSCSEIGKRMGFSVHTATSEAEARQAVRRRDYDLILLDLKIENGGLDLLREVRKSRPGAAVVVTTPDATVVSAVEAMRLGAVDYLTKPFVMEELTEVLDTSAKHVHFRLANRLLRDRLRSGADSEGLTGNSPEMEKLYRMLAKIIPATLPVLILGEEGTGKKRVARSIHRHGPRAESAYALVECATATPSEIEAQLFGSLNEDGETVDGALGLDGATVFFDEIDRLPTPLQTRLLRTMQERCYSPTGSLETLALRARILAGTRRDLKSLSETGSFRRDLYQRLNVVNLRLPSLRERASDIPMLVSHFLLEFGRNRDMSFHLSDDALALLTAYDWPGNVGELEAVLRRMAELASAPALDLDLLSTQLADFRRSRETQRTLTDARKPRPLAFSIGSLAMSPSPIPIAEQERRTILRTLGQMHGDKIMTAKVLGIGRTTLYRKLKTYGIGSAV